MCNDGEKPRESVILYKVTCHEILLGFIYIFGGLITSNPPPSVPMECYREEPVLQKILRLYDSIRGVPFDGKYEGTAPIQYDGENNYRHLVKVHSPNILNVMRMIWATDGGDMVWKGIVNDTFWIAEIDGPYMHTNTFKIVDVHYVMNLNWRRNVYHAVINVTLKAVY